MLEPNSQLAEKIILSYIDNPIAAETNQLIKVIDNSLKTRKQKYLTANELDLILKWKLDTQYMRSKKQRDVNVDSVVIPITTAAFSVKSNSEEFEIELKVNTLSCLKGIATPLASAVLAVTHPEKYAVIDSLLWNLIFDEKKSAFTTRDYVIFLRFIKKLSTLTNLTVQSTEHALWLYSMSNFNNDS